MKRKDYQEKTTYQNNEYKDDIVFARYINYMKKALLNRRLNYLKRKKYLLEKEISISNNEWEILCNKENNTNPFVDIEDYKIEKLRIAVNQLGKRQKEVIIKYYYKNQKLKVIAEEMNINENAVKQLKLRAINNLKNYLEEGNEE